MDFDYSVLSPFLQIQKSDNQQKTQSFGFGSMEKKPTELSEGITAPSTTAPASTTTAPLIMPNDLFLNGMSFTAPQNFMMMPQMVMDPNVLQCTMMPQIAAASMLSQRTQSATSTESSSPTKEIITYKSCVLYPPNPNAPPPTIRERPLGCRTVFVGGLPESITQDLIRKIFERCGEITTLRLSKKNFCHIRFDYEVSVDSAIYLSGYRIKINNSSEPSQNGRLHVDYAQARDDQFEWECKQRQLQREQRHKEQESRYRSVSPPPVVHYSDHEAIIAADFLKSDDTFMKGIQTVIAWLERGDCCKKNANSFYSMIQSVNAHGRRLNTEKAQQDEELRKVREQYKKNAETTSQQCKYNFTIFYVLCFSFFLLCETSCYSLVIHYDHHGLFGRFLSLKVPRTKYHYS